MLATFVNQTKPGAVPKQKNQTLEDVAEEMLNGMFCHYEPPDPRRVKKKSSKQTKTKGILRRRSMLNNKSSNGIIKKKRSKSSSPIAKTVTWSESVEGPEVSPKSQDVEEVPTSSCNVGQACLDAGIEVGCFGSKKNNEKVVSSYMNTDQKNKPLSHSRDTGIHSNAITPNHQQTPMPPPPPPPPPPLPPRTKERYFPTLCGVNITCGEGEEQMEIIANDESSSKTTQKRSNTRNTYEEEDDENSLLQEEDDGSDYDDEEEENEASDKENASDTSSPRHLSSNMRIASSRYHPSADDSDIVIKHNHYHADENEDERNHPSMRNMIDNYNINDAGGGDDEASTVSQKFFRRLWPRKRDRKSKGSDKKSSSHNGVVDEVDNSLKQRRGRNEMRQSSRSKSPIKTQKKMMEINSNETTNNTSKLHPTTSLVTIEENLNKSKILLLRGRSKSPRKSSNDKLTSGEADWDTSVPIAPMIINKKENSRIDSTRKESSTDPSLTNITKQQRRSQSSENRPPRRSKSPLDRMRNRKSTSAIESSSDNKDSRNNNITNNYDPSENISRMKISDSHQDAFKYKGRDAADDFDERQSFITAHREAFESDVKQSNNERTLKEDIALSKRAKNANKAANGNRQGYNVVDNNNLDPIIESKPYLNYDDMLERQSYITATREEFDKRELINSEKEKEKSRGRSSQSKDNNKGTSSRHRRSPDRLQNLNNLTTNNKEDGKKGQYDDRNTVDPIPSSHNSRPNNEYYANNNGRGTTLMNQPNMLGPQMNDLYMNNGQGMYLPPPNPGLTHYSPYMFIDPQTGLATPSYQYPGGNAYYTTDPVTGPMYHHTQPQHGGGYAPYYGDIGAAQSYPPMSYIGDPNYHPMSFPNPYYTMQHPFMHEQSSMPYGSHVPMNGDLSNEKPVDDEDSSILSENKEEEKKTEDFTWEERTRQAWEQLRNGIFSGDSSKEVASTETSMDIKSKTAPPPSPAVENSSIGGQVSSDPQLLNENLSQAPMQRGAHLLVGPQLLSPPLYDTKQNMEAQNPFFPNMVSPQQGIQRDEGQQLPSAKIPIGDHQQREFEQQRSQKLHPLVPQNNIPPNLGRENGSYYHAGKSDDSATTYSNVSTTLPPSILRGSSRDRRVTFGNSQERIIQQENTNENRSSMSYPDGDVRKKKVLRGKKYINNIFGKAKNPIGRINFTRPTRHVNDKSPMVIDLNATQSLSRSRSDSTSPSRRHSSRRSSTSPHRSRSSTSPQRSSKVRHSTSSLQDNNGYVRSSVNSRPSRSVSPANTRDSSSFSHETPSVSMQSTRSHSPSAVSMQSARSHSPSRYPPVPPVRSHLPSPAVPPQHGLYDSEGGVNYNGINATAANNMNANMNQNYGYPPQVRPNYFPPPPNTANGVGFPEQFNPNTGYPEQFNPNFVRGGVNPYYYPHNNNMQGNVQVVNLANQDSQ